jgi:ATP-dependent helicase/nuclease subunit A
MKLTSQQRRALEARDRSVALSAGAGCGKTFVLTERFLAAIDPGHPDAAELSQVAAITFTDAAAREMRLRIRGRCRQRHGAAENSSEAAAWLQHLRNIDAARISTIHSFCAALLRGHAVEAQVDPQFELLDPAAADLLQLEVIDDWLRQWLIQRDPEVMQLAADLTVEKLRARIREMVSSLDDRRPREWLGLTPEELVQRWNALLLDQILPDFLRELARHEAFKRLGQILDPALAEDPQLAAHLRTLTGWLERIAQGRINDPREIGVFRELAKTQGYSTEKRWHDAAHHQQYKRACEQLRKVIDSSIFGKYDSDPAHARRVAHMGLALLRLASTVRDTLQQRKSERNQLDYDDLMQRARHMLTEPANKHVTRQIAAGLKLLLVDEFQDTDPLQVELVQTLCPDWQQSGLFIVGDSKQSIYRFRGAEPSVSRQVRQQLPPDSQLALTANFRSQPAIIDFVNALFFDTLDEPYEALQATKAQVTPTPAIEFVWAPITPTPSHASGDVAASAGQSSNDRATSDDTSVSPGALPKGTTAEGRRREARWIARRLADLIECQAPLVAVDAGEDEPPTARPVQPGDVAILLRAMSDVAIYEEALREHGLDYHLVGGMAFYAQQEVFDVLNLLRAVSSTIDEPSLAGTLRSPMFALEDEALYWLVAEHGSLNAALEAGTVPPALESPQADRFRRAVRVLARLRAEKDRLLVAPLLRLACAETGYDAVLQAEFLGDRKLANLEKLIEQARSLDRTSPGDLGGFVTQLSELVAQAPKEAQAATQAEGNVVRLMTIHAAKGLEFPVVVIPDLDRRPNLSPGAAALDRRFGPVVPGVEGSGITGAELARMVAAIEEAEERKRLLYVACTRAADYLILGASIDDLERPKFDWLRMIGDRFDLATGAYRGPARPWELGGPPQIRVITSPPQWGSTTVAARRSVDLPQVIEQARAAAEKSSGIVPYEARDIPFDVRHQLRFSFSRMTGELARMAARGEEGTGREEQWERAEALPPTSHFEIASEVGPREIGILVHAALEQLDFSNPDDVSAACEMAAAACHLPHAAQQAAEALLGQFLKTARARELATAEQVLRERDFLLPWSLPDDPVTGRHLQGVIDCLYLDSEGNWKLLDYKTNRITPADVPRVAARYELQLYVYALACYQGLGSWPAEVVLHFLQPGVEHRFEWSESGRQAAAAQVTAAMQAVLETDPTP